MKLETLLTGMNQDIVASGPAPFNDMEASGNGAFNAVPVKSYHLRVHSARG